MGVLPVTALLVLNMKIANGMMHSIKNKEGGKVHILLSLPLCNGLSSSS